MKAAVFRGIGEIEIAEVPIPRPQEGEVLIRVGYCGICGSDLEAYHTGMYEPGLIIGHEFAGTIAALGEGVTGWQVGERVVVNDALPCMNCRPCRDGLLDRCENMTMIGVSHDGGMAEFVAAPALSLLHLPDGVTLRQGALAEPLAVALHGVRRSRLKAGDHVLVMGAGPIGLFTLQCALLAGARTVTVTEVNPTRAALAAHLGATAVLDPARDHVGLALAEVTGGYGPDVVYICTGAPAPYREAISLVRKGGQIFIIGLCLEAVETDFMSVALGELSIEGSFLARAEFPAALDFIAQRRVNVEALVSHEVSLEEAVSGGFARLEAPDTGAVKILVRIGGEE